MASVPSGSAVVPPILVAALLLVALPLLEALGLPHPTAGAVIAATGASRSRAYELRAAIEALLPSVLRPPGRPAKPTPPPIDTTSIVRAVRDFAFDHPGAVCGTRERRRYSHGFRCFVLDLVARHRELGLDAVAEAVGIPLPTLRDWLEGGVAATRPVETLAAVPDRDPTASQIETLLALWKGWQGGFVKFCTHVQHDWRIPFGRTLIAEILAAHGVRFAKRRTGRSPDEDALRGQFVTFFPNAQWVGDGSPLDVRVGGTVFTFNVELMVDPCSGAVTGASVRDTEDAAAVVEAFEDGVATTGGSPLAVLLDNKPSNHADTVVAALGGTKIVPATRWRPQNKAVVEGGFGLFQQVAPDLAVAPDTPHDLARHRLERIAAAAPASSCTSTTSPPPKRSPPPAPRSRSASAASSSRARRVQRGRIRSSARSSPTRSRGWDSTTRTARSSTASPATRSTPSSRRSRSSRAGGAQARSPRASTPGTSSASLTVSPKSARGGRSRWRYGTSASALVTPPSRPPSEIANASKRTTTTPRTACAPTSIARSPRRAGSIASSGSALPPT